VFNFNQVRKFVAADRRAKHWRWPLLLSSGCAVAMAGDEIDLSVFQEESFRQLDAEAQHGTAQDPCTVVEVELKPLVRAVNETADAYDRIFADTAFNRDPAAIVWPSVMVSYRRVSDVQLLPHEATGENVYGTSTPAWCEERLLPSRTYTPFAGDMHQFVALAGAWWKGFGGQDVAYGRLSTSSEDVTPHRHLSFSLADVGLVSLPWMDWIKWFDHQWGESNEPLRILVQDLQAAAGDEDKVRAHAEAVLRTIDPSSWPAVARAEAARVLNAAWDASSWALSANPTVILQRLKAEERKPDGWAYNVYPTYLAGVYFRHVRNTKDGLNKLTAHRVQIVRMADKLDMPEARAWATEVLDELKGVKMTILHHAAEYRQQLQPIAATGP
jgi:hypothetical protein